MLQFATHLRMHGADRRVLLPRRPWAPASTYSLNRVSRWSHDAPIAHIQASASANASVRNSYRVSRPTRTPTASSASSSEMKCFAIRLSRDGDSLRSELGRGERCPWTARGRPGAGSDRKRREDRAGRILHAASRKCLELLQLVAPAGVVPLLGLLPDLVGERANPDSTNVAWCPVDTGGERDRRVRSVDARRSPAEDESVGRLDDVDDGFVGALLHTKLAKPLVGSRWLHVLSGTIEELVRVGERRPDALRGARISIVRRTSSGVLTGSSSSRNRSVARILRNSQVACQGSPPAACAPGGRARLRRWTSRKRGIRGAPTASISHTRCSATPTSISSCHRGSCPTWSTRGRTPRWRERLASFSRLIVFDKRGTGMSDRPSKKARVARRPRQ